MKRIYWRPQKCSSRALFILCLLAVSGLLMVEWTARPTRSKNYERQRAAAELAQSALQTIRAERIKRGYPIDPEIDPAESGIVGLPISPITSIGGHLGAKQTSVNPNFAALVVQMLLEAGVKHGDHVAVGYSGSFPALNTAVCAALETLGARPIIIASAGASQYGANYPDFLWVDIERLLFERGLISFRSVAGSIGGYEDAGLGMKEEGRKTIRTAMRRNGLQLLTSRSFTANIDKRMEIYLRHAEGRPIRAYINVGGGTVSVGRALGKKLYDPGLNRTPTEKAMQIDSVMTRFARQGTPLIHMVEIQSLARAHGLPVAPTQTPPVGHGHVYGIPKYNRWLAAGVLIALVIAIRGFVLTDGGYRAVRRLRRIFGAPFPAVEETEKQPAWMV